MIFEPSDDDILELIKRKSNEQISTGQNWIVDICTKEITNLEATIAKLRKLINLSKNPEVVTGIELFIGKK